MSEISGIGERGAGYAFIVGHRKSGSTWLLNLLSLHPDIRGVMETAVFNLAWSEPDPVRRTRRLLSESPWSRGGLKSFAVERLRGLAPGARRAKPALALPPEDRPLLLSDLGLPGYFALRRELLGAADPEDYCRRLFGFLAARLRPPVYLLEKSPRNILHVDRIRALFPAAKLIAIHRDGRDVVVSDRFFTADYGGRQFSFEKGVRDWRVDMESQLRSLDRGDLFTCSYEELLEDGRRVVAELLAFLGLPAGEEIVGDLLERSSFRFYTGRQPGEEDRRRFYRKGVAGDWKNHFSEEQKAAFKQLAGDTLIALGYERDLTW
jgi:sulfotransferase family protein